MTVKGMVLAACPPMFRPWWDRIEASPIGYRLAKGVFWSMAGAVISRGLMLVASILVARMLGKIGYGELGMIQSTVGMFGVFAGFGLGLTATKHVAEFRLSDPARAGRIIGLSGLVAMATGGVMALGLFVFAPWLASHTINAPHLAGVLRIGAVILFISALNGAQTGALSGFEAFRTIAYVNLFIGLISFPIFVCGAYFGGLTGAVWALTVNLCFNWLLNHLALRKEARQYKVPFTFRECSRELSILFTFSLPVTLTSLVVAPVIWGCNSLLVNNPEGYAELGLYSAVRQLYLPAVFLTSILANVYLPILSNSYSVDSPSHFRVHAKKMLKTNGLALLVFSLLFLGLSPILLPFYGKDYIFRFSLVFFVALSATLSAFGGYLNTVLVAMHMPWYGFIGNALWAVIYVGLFLPFSRYGATGMAFSLTLSLIFSQTFIEYHMLKKIFPDKGNILYLVFIRGLTTVKAFFRKNRLRMSTTTAFFRNIVQLNTLYDITPSPRRIYVFACSNGCEAYSLAMLYHERNSGIVPDIRGFDIDVDCLSKARQGIYSEEDLLYKNMRQDESTVAKYLRKYLVPQNDGQYQITEDIRSRCKFEVGSILNPSFVNSLDKADIVLCQNVLIHMTEEQNKNAIESIIKIIQPGGLLVIGGMRLPVRAKIMKTIGLTPVTTHCREIHEAQKDLRSMWGNSTIINRSYIAMPPFILKDDWQYRFGTIFRVEDSRS